VGAREGTCTSCGQQFLSGSRGVIPTRCTACRNHRPCATCGHQRPQDRKRYCSDDCQPRCLPGTCDRLAVKNGYCENHNAAYQKYGDPLGAKYTWGPPGLRKRREGSTTGRSRATPAETHRCLVCDGTPETVEWRSSTRRWCTKAHARLWYKHGGQIPEGFTCVECETWVLYNTGEGKRLRSDSKLCRDCAKVRTYELTAWDLAKRDGNTCRLCGDPVDLSLRFPHHRSPSVDHIIPQSQGGGHHAENLQLACWICNVRRKDRPLGKGVTING